MMVTGRISHIVAVPYGKDLNRHKAHNIYNLCKGSGYFVRRYSLVCNCVTLL